MTADIPTFPDTALAQAANAFVLGCSPLPLVNHCRRTYLFGAALLNQAHKSFDTEAFYLASILHDLGLTETWEDGVTPFEKRGAAVAAEQLAQWGAAPELTSLVKEAIALHLKASTAEDPRPEVVGVSIGASVDVLGLRLDELPKHFVEQALEQYPRLGFKQLLSELIDRQTDLKPGSRIATYVKQFHFKDLVAATPFDD
ncbi:hypothetical protein Rhe02_61260 [Rhizocola hellebori]|uniref:HD domain-containing protein n=1 Tax=Rhizocola hellebori TaxID=1392758 RepID=A0A8J3QE49_9ACTN|nr:HD domain-containing protein [Rhizocola hellebori]GIH08059.1 hypothetical protein Rhe02_61260 [Rhizocola hellebori]